MKLNMYVQNNPPNAFWGLLGSLIDARVKFIKAISKLTAIF